VLAHLTSMLRRLAGIAVLALLLAGVPYALVHFLGSALPQQIPDAGQITAALSAPLSDEILGGLLVAVLWVAWAAFAWSVVAEFAAVFTGIRLPQPKAFAPTRGLAALLVAAITGGVLATAAQAAPPYGAAQAAAPATATVPAVVAQQHSAPAVASAVQDQLSASTAAVTKTRAEQVKLKAAGKQYTHTVRPGDSLSVIAKQWLGDANRWPEIFALNRGQHFTAPAGTLKDPQVIRAGWTLQLPDDATPPAGAKPDAPADQPAPDSPAEPATETPAGPGDQPGETASAGDAPQVGDDGVIDDDTDSSQAGDPGDAGDEQPDPGEDEQQAPAGSVTGVDLPSGSWVDVGLVAALLAAVALVWAHRQRRFQRRPLSRELADDPMPPVVRHVRRGLRRSAVTALDDNGRRELRAYREFFDGIRAAGDNENTRHRINGTAAFAPFIPAIRPTDTNRNDTGRYYEPVGPHDEQDATPGRYHRAHEPRHRREPDEQSASDPREEDTLDDDLLDDADTLGAGPVDVRRLLNDAPPPVTPALANPVAPAWPAAGIGLVGPGADAAARGFLVAALAAGGVGDFDTRSTVVIPAATLTTLLGADAIIMPQTPRLTVTASLSEALNLVEEQTLHRSRLLYEHEVEDALALRESDPMAEPVPPLVLIADVTAEHERARIAALLTQSQRLDIHGVLLGAWPHGDTVDVGIDGSTLPAGTTGRRRRHLADLGRLTVLTFAEAADLLRLLAESHTGQPQPTALTSRTDTTIASSLLAASTPTDGDGLLLFPELADRRGPAETPTPRSTEEPLAPEPAPEEASAVAPDERTRSEAPTADEPVGTPVVVQAFGKPRIVDAPADERVRPQAVELLVYLAARGGTASQDDILEDLLPEVTAKTAPHRLHTFTSNLRRIAGLIAGGGTFLTVERKQYRLHRAAFDIDLWRLQDAVAEAAATSDPAQQIVALRRAVDAYTAPLADTSRGYDWAEPYRENIRRQALNAALTLADMLDDHDEALAVLEVAIAHHRHAEDLYRAAMRRHGQRGGLDAVRQLQRTLTQALEELDAEPSDETMDLIDDLLAEQRRRPRTASTDRGRPR
jgi:two-component SAPR family response regulator/LysM repeat protein